jgi:succinate dehydrogenase/fumarate reductase flavoprotein subunit
VRTLFGTRADRLVTDGGRVCGVQAHRHTDGDGQVLVGARSGVVLATGGYQANPVLRQRFQPGFAAHSPYLGIEACRGDGHVIGAAVGGDLVNMTLLPPMVVVASTVVENAIAVNTAGVRFHDETGPFAERVDRLREQPGRRGWYLLDDRAATTHAGLIEQMPYPPVHADTLAGLATVIGVPADALTVQQWNDFLASPAGADPDYGRATLPVGRHGLTAGPFTAVAMVEGVNFSCGGFRTTTRMQVIDVFGTPIPGLYAAGDCAAGLNAVAESGGLHISGGLTLGRVAGHAATCDTDDTADHGSTLHTTAAAPALQAS